MIVFLHSASSDDPIVPAEVKTQQWLLPEATPGFNELPLQYKGVCGCTLVDRDGLILPGCVHNMYKHISMYHDSCIWVKT